MTDQLELETFLPYRLLRASEEISRRFARRYRERYNMTRPEWRTLATLGQYGNMTATEIGAHSSMHKTKVSRSVRALEDRRWLTRTTDEADRRVEHLALTTQGQSAYRELVGVAREFERAFSKRMGGKAIRDLEAGLDRIEALVHEERRDR